MTRKAKPRVARYTELTRTLEKEILAGKHPPSRPMPSERELRPVQGQPHHGAPH